ncbi:MAG: pseudouridine synthase [Chlamydiota bacterium]
MTVKNRLSKVLAAAGVASRRACEELIFEGRVRVNGAVVRVPQTLVSLDKDKILVNGKEINHVEQKVYYLLNKPKGYVCSNTRIGTKKIIIDLFEDLPYRLFTVGRLDRDTTGLLIVTNDGAFANQVIHPSADLSKEYLVKTSQEISHEHLMTISEGTLIEGIWVKPERVTKVRKGTLKVVVKEGKKREVRILVEKCGLDILELSRIRIGGLLLGPLPLGTWKEMTENEKKAIFS